MRLEFEFASHCVSYDRFLRSGSARIVRVGVERISIRYFAKIALAALGHLRAAGVPVTVNTQINRLSMPELPELLELFAGYGAHSWQIQLTVPMGRAADEPEVLLQPFDLLELFPLLGSLASRCKALGVWLLPGNNVGYFAPTPGD